MIAVIMTARFFTRAEFESQAQFQHSMRDITAWFGKKLLLVRDFPLAPPRGFCDQCLEGLSTISVAETKKREPNEKSGFGIGLTREETAPTMGR
jgi:hypothetical protein